jgi:hypothetical protein
MRHPSHLLPLVIAILELAACSDSTSPSSKVLGSTGAWYEGDAVQLDYTRPFQCKTPPTASSTSSCELGAPARTIPPNNTSIPVLYVMVPLGFSAPSATLHCPVAGNCVAHPTDLDLSRVFGAGTEKAPLPPHSHIVIDLANHADVPWSLEVIGVKDLDTWNTIAATQNLAEVRLLQLQDPNHNTITDDISTNIFLFFKVH